MWVFLNNAMVSIVENRADPTTLMVRARLKGDIRRAFPSAGKIRTTEDGDYRFRVVLSRDEVAGAIATHVALIDYQNFKNSIPLDQEDRHQAYLSVWSVMLGAQCRERDAEEALRASRGQLKLKLTPPRARSALPPQRRPQK
jgi:hypothetical protein